MQVASVACPHAKLGCEVAVHAQQLNAHLLQCPFEAMKGAIADRDTEIHELRQQMEQLHVMLAELRGDAATQVQTVTLEGHTEIVVALAVVDGMLLSGSMDQKLKLWNLNTHVCDREVDLGAVFALHVHEVAVPVQLGIQGNLNGLVVGQTQLSLQKLMFSGHQNSVKVWDMNNYTLAHTLSGHTGNVKALAASGIRLFSGSQDRSIKVWDLQTLSEIGTVPEAHSEEIRELQCVEDVQGQLTSVWSAGDDGVLKVWNSNLQLSQAFQAHKGSIRCMALRGNLLFTGSMDTYVKVWDVDNPQLLAKIPCLVGVTAVAVSQEPVSQAPVTLVTGHEDGVVKMWDVSDLGNIYNRLLINAHDEPVRALVIDGSTFYSGGYDKTIKVFYPAAEIPPLLQALTRRS